jgi:pathogenesis-related protein 1
VSLTRQAGLAAGWLVAFAALAACADLAGALPGAGTGPTAGPTPTPTTTSGSTTGGGTANESRTASPPTRTTGEPATVAGITAAHNRVREQVGVPPLRWSADLAASARRWANACVDQAAPFGMIDHSPSQPGKAPVGENLYATTAPRVDPLAAVAGWADEARDYDYARNACRGPMCGHYTQVVWRTTREVGCAVGSCPGLRFRSTLVCHYAPAGNIVGQRPY